MNNKRINKRINQDGVFITGNENDIFHFIENSTIELLSDSSAFGIIFIAILNPDIETNIKHMDLDNFNKPVKKILIKLSFIHNDKATNFFKISGKRYSFIDNFINEVNVQTELFYKSYEYLQPICPAILSALTIMLPSSKSDKLTTLLKVLSNKNTKINEVLKSIIEHDIKFAREIGLGIIVMEYADGYDLLNNYVKNDRNNITKYIQDHKLDLDLDGNIDYENIDKLKKDHKDLYNMYSENLSMMIMCFYLILSMAKMGYSHGDFHMGNILFNKTSNNFISKHSGRPLLIDFGLVVKLNTIQYDTIINNITSNKFIKALKFLYSGVPNLAGINLALQPQKYGYIAGYYDTITQNIQVPDKPIDNLDITTITTLYHLESKPFNYLPFKQLNINNIIKDFETLRETQIDNNIKIFNSKSREERNGVFLPLSITHIGKMFKGIFHENKVRLIKNENEKESKSNLEPKLEAKPKKTLLKRLTRKITKPFRKIMKQKSREKEMQKAMENEMQIERQQIFESEFPFANVNNFSFLSRKRSTGKRSVKLRNTKKLNSNA